MADYNRTPGWKYRQFILAVFRKLDIERRKWFGGGSQFTHSSRNLYDPVVQMMSDILTWSDLNESSSANPRDRVYKFRIRTELQDMKRDGLVETDGHKQGWRLTKDRELES